MFRLLLKPFSAHPFDGEGSYLYGGRWSSPGTRIVYTSEHLSLAMVEYLAHLDAEHPPREMVLARAQVPDHVQRIVLEEAELPGGWHRFPVPDALADLGDKFVREGKATVLVVPSALVPGERNWLLNPAHAEFRKINLLKSQPFSYNARLLR